MVAVAADHAQHRFVEPLGHLRRVGHGTSRRTTPRRPSARSRRTGPAGTAWPRRQMKRIVLNPITLGLNRSRRRQVGIVRQLQADRAAVAGVRRAEEDPPAVEPEIAVRRSGNRGSRSDASARRTTPSPRPAPGPSRDRGTDRSAPRAAGWSTCSSASISVSPGGSSAVEPHGAERLAAGRRGDRELDRAPATACGRRCGRSAWTRITPVFQSGRDEQVLDADRRRHEQLHRIDDAALVAGAARP